MLQKSSMLKGFQMAKFLTTTSLNYFLEELIRKSGKQLILVSPYLKINARIRELLADKVAAGVKVQIVYGKTDIAASEKSWFAENPLIDVRFCQNLHAKCYMNDSNAIITSLNLYEFSQINNNEMGVLLTASKDQQAFQDTVEEVSRLVKNSGLVSFLNEPQSPELDEEVRSSGLISDLVSKAGAALKKAASETPETKRKTTSNDEFDKLTTGKLAKLHGCSAAEMNVTLAKAGYLEDKGSNTYYLTDKGKSAGAEFRKSQYGIYFLWPQDLAI